MKFNGEYTESEREALECAARAANQALRALWDGEHPHRFHVSFLELGGSEDGVIDPLYSIGVDAVEMELND